MWAFACTRLVDGSACVARCERLHVFVFLMGFDFGNAAIIAVLDQIVRSCVGATLDSPSPGLLPAGRYSRCQAAPTYVVMK